MLTLCSGGGGGGGGGEFQEDKSVLINATLTSPTTRQFGLVLLGSSSGPGMQHDAVGEGGHTSPPLLAWPPSLQPKVVGEYCAWQHSPVSAQNVVVLPHWRSEVIGETADESARTRTKARKRGIVPR